MVVILGTRDLAMGLDLQSRRTLSTARLCRLRPPACSAAESTYDNLFTLDEELFSLIFSVSHLCRAASVVRRME